MKKDVQILFGVFAAMGLMQRCATGQSPAATEGIITGYLNSKLPDWLRLGGEDRLRLESLDGVSFKSGGNTYLLQRLRLNLEATPLPWLKFAAEMQDSRVFLSNVSPAPSSQQNPMDLRLGYLQLGNSESGAVSLRAGRQSLAFGEGRLVADPNWSNVGRTFDGLRLTVRYRGIRVDAFTGASDKVNVDGFDMPSPAQHFHGAYGSLDRVIPRAVLEPYVFWRLEHNVKGELTKVGNLDEKTLGVRSAGKLPFGFDYGWELAVQRGQQANESLSAWAGHWIVGHTLADTRHRPRLFAEFNRASGDQNPRDGIHGAFDPLFPSSHDKFGAADQITWTNIAHARAGLQYTVRNGLAITPAYNSFWLANRHDGIYSGGKVLIASNGLEGSLIGQEADLQAKWNATHRTLVDLVVGQIFPGEFLRKAGRGSPYHCLLLGVTQHF